ncbi:MAG: hypothetical protein G01um101425_507 [Candidatus Peregrinibacteria bacterium Gr01-1014_25]|nr:MAG: hypothetical protein G01um101425_507 [Candidatus Peregrinibacteria bacterium Gr01-1014_25]
MMGDAPESHGTVRAKSEFQRKLDAMTPEERARIDAVRDELRRAANEELKAIERSEMLTAEDFAIVINARAPQFEL